ncbi:hypothetical protein ES705_10266 [subsurface metagenome]
MRHFINDPEREVRDELHDVFTKNDLLNDPEHETFLQEYIRSQAFADNPDSFIRVLKDSPGRLIPLKEVIFSICEEFTTTLKEKSRYVGSIYTYTVSEMSSILLRLYEQAQGGERNKQIADHCLDIWDLFFENRVGRVIEMTRSIEK